MEPWESIPSGLILGTLTVVNHGSRSTHEALDGKGQEKNMCQFSSDSRFKVRLLVEFWSTLMCLVSDESVLCVSSTMRFISLMRTVFNSERTDMSVYEDEYASQGFWSASRYLSVSNRNPNSREYSNTYHGQAEWSVPLTYTLPHSACLRTEIGLLSGTDREIGGTLVILVFYRPVFSWAFALIKMK